MFQQFEILTVRKYVLYYCQTVSHTHIQCIILSFIKVTFDMLPRLTLDQLTQKVEQSRYLADDDDDDDAIVQSPAAIVKSKEEKKKKKNLLPTIPVPPRSSEKDLYLTQSDDAVWYMVLSPREVRGVSGKTALERLYVLLIHSRYNLSLRSS